MVMDTQTFIDSRSSKVPRDPGEQPSIQGLLEKLNSHLYGISAISDGITSKLYGPTPCSDHKDPPCATPREWLQMMIAHADAIGRNLTAIKRELGD